jgi:3-oxoacid CoA-transferase A subunit
MGSAPDPRLDYPGSSEKEGEAFMAVNKLVSSAAEAVADIPDGATILVGGFGVIQGWPTSLMQALRDQGTRDLTVICNVGGVGPTSPQMLAENGQIKKVISTYGAVPKRNTPLDDAIRAGEIELEMVPQGTLIERVRAGGSGLAAFYTPTGVGTDLAKGKEEREFDGKKYLLERRSVQTSPWFALGEAIPLAI